MQGLCDSRWKRCTPAARRCRRATVLTARTVEALPITKRNRLRSIVLVRRLPARVTRCACANCVFLRLAQRFCLLLHGWDLILILHVCR